MQDLVKQACAIHSIQRKYKKIPFFHSLWNIHIIKRV